MTIGTFLVDVSILMFIDGYESQNPMQMHPSLFISPKPDQLIHGVMPLVLNLSVEAFVTRNNIISVMCSKSPSAAAYLFSRHAARIESQRDMQYVCAREMQYTLFILFQSLNRAQTPLLDLPRISGLGSATLPSVIMVDAGAVSVRVFVAQ